jgi:hypothetical protein
MQNCKPHSKRLHSLLFINNIAKSVFNMQIFITNQWLENGLQFLFISYFSQLPPIAAAKLLRLKPGAL